MSGHTAAPLTEIELLSDAGPPVPTLLAVKLLEHCAVYRQGGTQYVDYFGEALTIFDDQFHRVRIHSGNPDRLFELAFLAVHSVLGQKLDRLGLCRLHGLGVSLPGINAIVMLPSKGGKSTLLKNLLENPQVKIISDDMPLCNQRGQIFPFPAKISLSTPPVAGPLSQLAWHEFKRHHYPTKWTASLAALDERIEKNSHSNRTLLIAGLRLSNGNSSLFEVPKWKMAAPLLEHMIMGFGLPQILEMLLKFNPTDLCKLFLHALHRTASAFNLARTSRCYHFHLGPDRVHNAKLLLDLLYEHKAS
ncbi:MAG TPA: hypothetical protein VNJ01_07875 [Bacteriovoracaceae bacterium]|nr:hypothetical protein [Bacteriovoracaceae bacterium]